jgi:ribonuclease Z
LYLPPYRVQGISVAGEETAIAIPELDVCFDIGRCPRVALTSPIIALTHGHMDHSAGLAYYYSQRHFQGMSPGNVVCHPALEQPIKSVMRAWVDLEGQRTPHVVTPLAPEASIEVKNHIFLKAIEVDHRVPALGFVIYEKRSKLRADLTGIPQERLIELKKRGEALSEIHEIPLVAFTGDTSFGKHLIRPEVLNAKILIAECTFLDGGHRQRAGIGKHMHLDDIIELLSQSKAEAVVLTHFSRRTHMGDARKQIAAALPEAWRDKVFLLMDNKTNRNRYQAQQESGQVAGEADGKTDGEESES